MFSLYAGVARNPIVLKCESIVLKDLLLPYFVSFYLLKTKQEAEKLFLKEQPKVGK